jgi:hypothetical protein
MASSRSPNPQALKPGTRGAGHRKKIRKKNPLAPPAVYNIGEEKFPRPQLILSGRVAMYNPWAVSLIILFSMLFLIGINIGELDFLWELGKTICLSCIGVG